MTWREARGRVGALVFSGPVITRVSRWLGPGLAGRLCARLVRDPGGGGPAHVFIVRDVAHKDLEQLRQRSRGRWLALSQDLLYRVQLAWLPESFFPQLEFQRRLETDPSLRAGHALRFATALVRGLRRRHDVRAIVSSNVDYAQDEFVRQACQAAGIPFVVLLKEHVNTAYGERAWSAEYRRTGYRYRGDAVAVFGPRTRQILIDHGVCPADRIHVTGPPRFDAWAAAPAPGAVDTVVLCAFSHPGQEGAAAFPEVLRAFVALIATRPDLSFVVKARDRFETDRVLALLGALPEGLTVTHDVPMSELLSRAALVAGFGSLALVEALYSPAEVVSIRFAGCSDDEDVQFDERDRVAGAVVRFAHTPEELRDLVAAAPTTPVHPQAAARRALLHALFCAPRPTYSEAFDDVLAATGRAAAEGSVR